MEEQLRAALACARGKGGGAGECPEADRTGVSRLEFQLSPRAGMARPFGLTRRRPQGEARIGSWSSRPFRRPPTLRRPQGTDSTHEKASDAAPFAVAALGLCSILVASEKPRVIVTSDGEIDDECSLVRFLLYANEWDIEGIITSSSQYHWQGHKWAGDDWAQLYLAAYARSTRT